MCIHIKMCSCLVLNDLENGLIQPLQWKQFQKPTSTTFWYHSDYYARYTQLLNPSSSPVEVAAQVSNPGSPPGEVAPITTSSVLTPSPVSSTPPTTVVSSHTATYTPYVPLSQRKQQWNSETAGAETTATSAGESPISSSARRYGHCRRISPQVIQWLYTGTMLCLGRALLSMLLFPSPLTVSAWPFKALIFEGL